MPVLLACVSVRIPPFTDNGPTNVAACTAPFAPVASKPFEIPEIVRFVVDALVAESDVVVAPVAVIF